MLRREDDSERLAVAEPSGELGESRRRRRRVQELSYWGSLLLFSGLLALFLVSTLPDRSTAERANRNEIATISAQKTEVASATAVAATEAAGGQQ